MRALRPESAIWLCLVAVPAFVAGCGEGRTPPPIAPSALPASNVPAQPPGRSRINGLVQDAAFRPLHGATVEVIGGAGAGLKTTTDTAGNFSLSGDFDITTRLRASQRIELLPTERAVDSSYIWFKLDAAVPAVNISGNYTITFVADRTPACEGIPEELRKRTYLASLTRSGADSAFNLAITGAKILDLGYPPVGVVGNLAGLALFEDGLPYLVEDVRDGVIEITGYAQASIPLTSGQSVSVPFEGWINYVAKGSLRANRVECKSNTHEMILTRR